MCKQLRTFYLTRFWEEFSHFYFPCSAASAVFLLPEKPQFTLSWPPRQKDKDNGNEHINMTDWVKRWQCKISRIPHWHFVNLYRATQVIFCSRTCSCHLFISMMVRWDTWFSARLTVSTGSRAKALMIYDGTIAGLLSLSIISTPNQ